MLKFGKKTSDPQATGGTPDPNKEKGCWFKDNQHSLIIAAILLLAFLLRFVFAYGLSAGSGYALSGGTSASEHLHTITEILSAGTIFGAVIGAFIMGILNNGMSLYGWSTDIQKIVKGAVLLVAVTADLMSKRKKS